MKKLLITGAALLASIILFSCGSSETPENPLPEGFADRSFYSVNAEDSTYGLYLEEGGTFELVDIGAGNPSAKGVITISPGGQDRYVMDCSGDDEFDSANPLGLKERETECRIEFREPEGADPRCVIIRNGKIQVRFEETEE